MDGFFELFDAMKREGSIPKKDKPSAYRIFFEAGVAFQDRCATLSTRERLNLQDEILNHATRWKNMHPNP